PSVAAGVLDAARALAWNRGQAVTAVDLAERALTIWRELGDLEEVCAAMMFRDVLALERGDLAASLSILQEVAAFAREHNLRQLPNVLVNLADVWIAHGDLEQARMLCEEALGSSDGPGSIAGTMALINLTEIANTQGRAADGAAFGRQAAEAALNRGDLLTAAWATIVSAWSLAELGELERAARLLAAGTAFVADAGTAPQRTELVSEERVLRALATRFDDRQVQGLLAQGRGMPIEAAIRDAASGPHPAASPTPRVSSATQ